MVDKNSFIGIFDSGIGGLAVVNTLLKTLPSESLIYIADSMNFPYGTKTEKQIKQFSARIVKYLTLKNVKAIIVACNTVSSVALPTLSAISGSIPVFGMVQSGATLALKTTKNMRIGIISTPLTASTHAYRKEIKKLNKEAEVFEVGSQELVNLVEDGKPDNENAFYLANKKLSGILRQNIDTLVLGCTHFPFLYKVVRKVVGKNVAVVDPSDELVGKLKIFLNKNNLLCSSGKRKSIFLTTGDKNKFLLKAKIFLEINVNEVSKLNL